MRTPAGAVNSLFSLNKIFLCLFSYLIRILKLEYIDYQNQPRLVVFCITDNTLAGGIV